MAENIILQRIRQSYLIAWLWPVIVAGLFIYGLTTGATYNGILDPNLHLENVILLAVIFAAWLVIRWRRGWTWHTTPLDGAFLLWGLAFGLSLLANAESWRRISTGLWYMGLYIGVWWMLHDALANGGLRRETLFTGLLAGGAVVVVAGYLELRPWFTDQMPLMAGGAIPFSLPRPSSTLSNANTLGDFLALLIPFIIGGFLAVRGRWRVALGVYSLLAAGLLALTFSRGAWIGLAVGLVVQGVLHYKRKDSTPGDAVGEPETPPPAPPRIRGGESDRGSFGRIEVGSPKVPQRRLFKWLAALVIAVGITGMGVLFIRSFSLGERSTTLRTDIYAAAWQMFTEKPLTGYGLFTFGRGLARAQSMPPSEPHSHAHDTPLNVAAEMGLVGLAALAFSIVVSLRAMRRNYRDTQNQTRERTLLAAAIGGTVAFGVHQLFDLPAMMPAAALVGLVALALATAPVNMKVLAGAQRRIRSGLGVGLWIAIVVSGLWSSQIYSRYWAAVSQGKDQHDYAGSVASLQAVIDADPSQAVYQQQQGFMLGLMADDGDLDAARRAAAVYERYVTLEPDYAMGWANLAALRWQLGDQAGGLAAMQTAVERAPQAWSLVFDVGAYAEAMGETDIARQSYEQAISVNPDAILDPLWEQTALQRELAAAHQAGLSIPAQVVNLLNQGDPSGAQLLWENSIYSAGNASPDHVIGALLALAADNNRQKAVNELTAARQSAGSQQDQGWIHLGNSWLARFDGDNDTAQQELDAARRAVTPGPFDEDYYQGPNINYIQFLELGIPRLFLPQVHFQLIDSALMHLLAQ